MYKCKFCNRYLINVRSGNIYYRCVHCISQEHNSRHSIYLNIDFTFKEERLIINNCKISYMFNNNKCIATYINMIKISDDYVHFSCNDNKKATNELQKILMLL